VSIALVLSGENPVSTPTGITLKWRTVFSYATATSFIGASIRNSRLSANRGQVQSFGHERLYEQAQQDATHLSTRPASTAKHSVVAMEALLLIQAHRS
jgi:urease accessory protein UreF